MSDSKNPADDNSDHPNHAHDQARHAADTVRDAASEALREMRERGEAVASDLKGRIEDLQEDVEKYVRENPTRAVLMAGGVGFILGLLIRR